MFSYVKISISGLELFKFFDEIVAIIRMDLDVYRAGKIKTENSEYGFSVNDVSVAAKVDFVRIFLYDRDESFYLTCHL